MSDRAASVLRRVLRDGASALTDRELLRRFAADGDPMAFALIVARHSALVFGVCRRGLPTEQDAEDACQATFLLLARKAGSGRWQPSLANWLFGTARKVAANARRSAARRRRHEARAAKPVAIEPIDAMTGRELLAVLDDELERLSPLYREPLMLCYLEGLTRDEAAVRLGIPPATLKSRLERGRQKLGERLRRRGCTLGAGLLATATVETMAVARVEAIVAAVADGTSPAVLALTQGATMNKVLTAIVATLGLALMGLGLGLGRQPLPKDATPLAVSGRVLDPDGKPVAAATVRLHQDADPPGADAASTTGPDGSFRVPLPARKPLDRFQVWASAAGFGMDWATFANPPAEGVTLRLVRDVPIVGQLVTADDKPLAGANVIAGQVLVPAKGTDDYLAAWDVGRGESWVDTNKVASIMRDNVTATTDADGRFTLRGIGVGRAVQLHVRGAGAADEMFTVLTRPGFDPTTYNDSAWRVGPAPVGRSRLYGPELRHFAQTGVTVEGVVKDAATGRPLGGWLVRIQAYHRTTTAADGSFRLTALAKNAQGYELSVTHGSVGTSHLARNFRCPDGPGVGPFRTDVPLMEGAAVSGRVFDRQTGRGVAARVWCQPVTDKSPAFRRANAQEYGAILGRSVPTDADGTFRFGVVPGRTIVFARADGCVPDFGVQVNPYRRLTPDKDALAGLRFTPELQQWLVVREGRFSRLLLEDNAMAVVEIPDTGRTGVDLPVDRGATATLEIRDAAGQPLAGAWVALVSADWPRTVPFQKPTGTIYGLDPARPRTVVAYHPERKLSGTATVRGDEAGPVVLELGPMATVRGRLLDWAKRPLAGASVSVALLGDTAEEEIYSRAKPPGAKAVTDADGRFALNEVLPDVRFGVSIQRGGVSYRVNLLANQKILKPRGTIDLGDLEAQ